MLESRYVSQSMEFEPTISRRVQTLQSPLYVYTLTVTLAIVSSSLEFCHTGTARAINVVTNAKDIVRKVRYSKQAILYSPVTNNPQNNRLNSQHILYSEIV